MPVQTPTDSKPEVRTPVGEIETPALIVDLETMENNVRNYAAIADEHDVRLRSHVKTHKIPYLSHYQHRATDGGGIVCQTLSEAEVMAASGIDDIYLSYMVVGRSKLERLVALSSDLDYFATTVDCEGNVRPLQTVADQHGETVDVVLELNVGLDRVGVEPDEAVETAEFISDQPNLNLLGVMAFEGHLFGDDDVRTADEYERACIDILDEVERTVDSIRDAGVPVREVKVGSTATSLYSSRHPVVTEINPGMYIFNDANLVEKTPHVSLEDCALSVITTVISTPTDNRVVVDAGSKSISLETDGEPVSRTHDDLDYYRASEEHGWIDTSSRESSISVGDKIEFIPPHVCPTVNLHDTLVGTRNGTVENVWDIQARGKVK